MKDRFKILVSTEEIQQKNIDLANQIVRDFGTEPFLLLSILTGSFIFSADLCRAIVTAGGDPIIAFLSASSYGSQTTSSGNVSLTIFKELSLSSKRVLLVDDILDTGYTLSHIKNYVLAHSASFCKTAVLLDKPSRRKVSFSADYCGFTIDDHFVVGYGLDLNDQFRSLPYVAIIQDT